MIQRILPAALAAWPWACSDDSGPAAPAAPSPMASAAPDRTLPRDVRRDLERGHASRRTSRACRTSPASSAATHREAQRFWQPGALATEGIRAMAEQGRKTPLDQEVQAAIAAGGAQHLLSGGDVDLSPGSVALEFEISREHPFVTLVTMVAPSPDWFVGRLGARRCSRVATG